MKLRKPTISSFSKIISFTLLCTIGFLSIKSLSVRLEPKQTSREIAIRYTCENFNPRVLEGSVTSILEKPLSTLQGLTEISSISSKGSGYILLRFNESTNLSKIKLHISSILRRLYPLLPKGVSFPEFQSGNIKENLSILMTLSLNSQFSSKYIGDIAKNQIKPKLSKIKGLKNINISGIPQYKYVILCDVSKIENYGLNIEEIKQRIQSFLKKENIGIGLFNNNRIHIEIDQILKNKQVEYILNAPISKVSSGVIHLKDIASISLKKIPMEGIKRFNGQNSITINIEANPKENQLEIVKELYVLIQKLNWELKDKVSLNILYDSTAKLKEELHKVAYRTILSVIILLFFVFLFSRNLKYLLSILISIVSNILVAIIFYHLFSIDIHIYSLAGLTISFGIIIDNSIIMIDHLLNYRKERIFLSILAATLTTIASLVIIFFLKEEYQFYLIDFSAIIIINLIISLFISNILIPSLFERLGMELNQRKNTFKRKRLNTRFLNYYTRFLKRLLSWRIAVFFLMLFLFGIPLFLIPERINTPSILQEKLNPLLESQFYKDNIIPSYKYLGGTLYPFFVKVKRGFVLNNPERISLNVRIINPEGSTISQLDNSVKRFENYLSELNKVETFHTDIANENLASIKIYFRKSEEYGDFPYTLKNNLETIATETGGIDCIISGVGLGFSNSANLISDGSMKLTGYDYDRLLLLAANIRDSLFLTNPRINRVRINSDKTWILNDKYEYGLKLKNENNISKHGVGTIELLDHVRWYSGNNDFVTNFNNIPIEITGRKRHVNQYELEQIHLFSHSDSTYFTLGEVAHISKNIVAKEVIKKNGVYQVFLDYSFAGTIEYRNIIFKTLLNQSKDFLPIGYEASDPDEYRNMSKDRYIIFKVSVLILLIVYFICAILFESFIQPLAVIFAIPTSYIGIFLTFTILDIPFDQGGLASFIMLSGIVVNSSIYIINQLNNQQQKGTIKLRSYILAFNAKIYPIVLTIFSTICGLIPFIFLQENSFFWTSFAYGNIGGLLFSLIILIFFLPLCLNIKA